MKAVTLLLLSIVTFGMAVGGEPDVTYLQVDVMLGDYSTPAEAGMMSGSYIGLSKKYDGLFYMNDDGSGVYVGSIINDLVPDAGFELIYSITLNKENDQEVLVGTAYAMKLSSDGEILRGRKTPIRQALTYGKDIVLPVGELDNGETIYLKMLADREEPNRSDQHTDAPITLISTQLLKGKQWGQARNWCDQLVRGQTFRTGFSSKEKNGHYEFLKYEIEIEVDCEIDIGIDFSSDADLVKEPLRGQLSFIRRYTIDTLHYARASFSPDVVYTSQYTKDIEIAPGKMLKLIFPPDTPSVRGFDIEDTLIIVPQ
jgi:hypothetical protein